MKLGTSRYGHKSIPDAKFESGSSSSFRDMTSQNFPRKRERVIRFGYLPLKNRLNLKKMSFYVHNRSSRPKLTPQCQFQQFPSGGKCFHFVNFWDISMRKEQQQPPRFINVAKIWSEHLLKINTKSQKVWAS